MKEEWKEIIGLNGDYLISSYGRCFKNFPNTRCGNPYKSNNEKEVNLVIETRKAYRSVFFKFRGPNSKKCIRAAGLLVAVHFLPNPLNRKRSFPKDGAQLNCRVDNLEWSSGGSIFTNKQEYLQHLRNADVGKRKNKETCDAIIQYLEGDKSKIEEILKKARPIIYWRIKKILGVPWASVHGDSRNIYWDNNTVNDLVQESLIKIYQKINQLMFFQPKNPHGWFVKIAQNIARNYRKKEMNKKKYLRLERYCETFHRHNT